MEKKAHNALYLVRLLKKKEIFLCADMSLL